jgi:hypothetical protein
MNRLKKLFAMAAVLAFGLMIHTNAFAQTTVWDMYGDPRVVRATGTAEVLGQVVFTAEAGGSILDGATITVGFLIGDEMPGQAIDISDGNGDTANAVFAQQTGGCTVTAGEPDDNEITITFDACTTLSEDTSVVIQGIAVNVTGDMDLNGMSVFAMVATGGTNSPSPGAIIVRPTREANFTASYVKVGEISNAYTVTVVPGMPLLTCAANAMSMANADGDIPGAIGVTIMEAFGLAFEESMVFKVVFEDVPEDVMIQLNTADPDPSASPEPTFQWTADPVPMMPQSGDEDGDDLEWEFSITATTFANEEMELSFSAYSTASTLASVSDMGMSIDVETSYTETADDDAPELSLDDSTAFVINNCVTRLLYSWVVSGVAGYDTGIAIANTSEDDAAFGMGNVNGAQAQEGSCTLTGYPAAGAPVGGELAPISHTSGIIKGGQTWAFNVSMVPGFTGFSGYVLGVCNFLNAHSFAFISNSMNGMTGPTLAQGYEASIVPTGGRVIPAGEELSK